MLLVIKPETRPARRRRDASWDRAAKTFAARRVWRPQSRRAAERHAAV